MLEDELKGHWKIMKKPILLDALRRGRIHKINGEECLVVKGFGDDPRGNCLYAASDGRFYVKHDQDGKFSIEEGFTDVKRLEVFTDYGDALDYAQSTADFKD